MMADFAARERSVTFRAVLILLGAALMASVMALARAFDTFPGDEWALLELRSLRDGGLPDIDWAAAIVSGIGKGGAGLGIGIPWIAVAVIAGALGTRRWGYSTFLIAALAAPVINLGLKELAARPRPNPALALVEETGHSFPSGHAVFAAAFFGALIILLERAAFLAGRPILRRSVQAVLVLLILAVGVSRVYLGVHWPSDVIGAYAFALLYLAALVGVSTFLEQRQ